MPIAFSRVSIHTRSKGHSAVAGAAYRSGAALFDRRTGETHDFKNKQGIKHTEILLPEGGSLKYQDRETLWNAIEENERRQDSQLAKDVILALPKEVDLSKQIELAKSFAEYHFVSKGLVADIAIHDSGDGNPHAHLYISTRRLKGDAFDRYKARDLNPTFSNSRGSRGFVSEQDYWGEQWRGFQNDYFEKKGLDIVVDENHLFSHRHEGRPRRQDGSSKVSNPHYLSEENALKRAAALEIALNDPDSLINLLGQRHGVFSERQLASLIFKCTQTSEQFSIAMAKVKGHSDVIHLGQGTDGKARYTTRANYLKETTLSERAEKLANQSKHAVSSNLINKMAKGYNLSSEQLQALKVLVGGQDLVNLVGRAGTGKSYLMKAAHDVWIEAGFTVKGISVSGVAAKGLTSSSGIASSTIASFRKRLQIGSLTLSKQDIIVMDEAGMTDLNDMAAIMRAVSEAGAKLVLVGDHAQLQPVGPGAPFRAIVEQVGFSELSTIRRQSREGDRIASQDLAAGRVEQALDYYEQQSAIQWQASPDDALQALIKSWTASTNQNDLSEQIILAHRNRDVDELNRLARRSLMQAGILQPEESSQQSPEFDTKPMGTVFEINRSVPKEGEITGLEALLLDTTATASTDRIPLCVGDRILFKSNDRALGVFNGDFATVVKVSRHELSAKLDSGELITFDPRTYKEFDYGYAATVHKSQGATIDRVYVYAGGKAWNKHLAYVALTRHRHQVELYADQETLKDTQALKEAFSRDDIKDSVLDFPLSYGRRRGFDPETLIDRWMERLGYAKDKIKDKWALVWDVAGPGSKKRNETEIRQNEPDNFQESQKEELSDKRQDKPQDKLQNNPEILAIRVPSHREDAIIRQDLQLQEPTLKWEVLNTVEHGNLALIASCRQIAIEHADPSQQPSIHHSELVGAIEKLIQSTVKNQDEMASLKRLSPELYQHFKAVDIALQDKDEKTIDWQAVPATDWNALRGIKKQKIDLLLTYADLIQKHQDPIKLEQFQKTMTQFSSDIASDERLFKQVENASPRLAKLFKEAHQWQTEKNKAYSLTLNWQTVASKTDWDKLRSMDNEKIKLLLTYSDLIQKHRDNPAKLDNFNQTLTQLAGDVASNERLLNQVAGLSPSLAKTFKQANSLQQVSKALSKSKDRGMERSSG